MNLRRDDRGRPVGLDWPDRPPEPPRQKKTTYIKRGYPVRTGEKSPRWGKPPTNKTPQDILDKAYALWKEGLTLREISPLVGVSKETLYNNIRSEDFWDPTRDKGKRPKGHGRNQHSKEKDQ